MRITPTDIADVKLIAPVRHEDPRGFFVETYNWETWSARGITQRFVQDNHSLSRIKGTIRGLHFQTDPFAQDKLVRVIRGSILDVAVDIRQGSSTYGRHVAVTLTADDPTQILVPVGFAHGFCTLEPDTEVVYKVSNVYSQPNDRSLRWNDPALGIAWPVGAGDALVSDKDAKAPLFAELGPQFTYG
jgi:dTDP-4-dehydrorhamnose 3,5-epimerase